MGNLLYKIAKIILGRMYEKKYIHILKPNSSLRNIRFAIFDNITENICAGDILKVTSILMN